MKSESVDITNNFTRPVMLERGSGHSLGIIWLLWVAGASLPWLLPTHSPIWVTFYSEWLMAVMLLLFMVWGVLAAKKKWPVSWLVLVVLAAASIPLGQSIAGLMLFPGEAVVQAICIFAIALAVLLGQWEGFNKRYRLIDGLFASLVIAALISTGLSLYQWLGLSGWGVLLPAIDVGGLRAVANVGQANNLATLLVWGGAGLWWGGYRKFIGPSITVFAAAFLLIGIVLTGSRTGCIQVVFMGVMVLFSNRAALSVHRLLLVAMLVGWMVFLWAILPVLREFLFGTEGREILSVGLRPAFWSMALEALVRHPFIGYGWNQVATVHVLFSDSYSGLGEVMGHAHNLFLDLLLWSGVFLGGGVILGVVWWLSNQFLNAVKEPHFIILTALGVFLIHAMLELPHLYAFFYLPVGLMIGAASGYAPIAVAVYVSRGSIFFVCIILALLLGIMFRDYRSIEADLFASRMFSARIAGAEKPSSPGLVVFGYLQEALESLRTEPRRGMTNKELENLRRSVERYPTVEGSFRYAQSAALNYRVDEAAWALRLICSLRSLKVCTAATNDWAILAQSDYPEMRAVPMPRRVD